MKLYHYTSVPLAESILSSALKFGHLTTMRGIIPNVVWLTSDPSSEGHGLLTGDEKNLTESQVRHIETVQGGPLRNTVMQAKTAVRLTFLFPDEWAYVLQNYVEYCRTQEGGELFARTMGLSCYVDINAASDKRLKFLMKTLKTKEKTWWISFTPVPSSLVVAIDARTSAGYEPYSFEVHGRPGMEEVGFHCPSEAALLELQRLLPGRHPFEKTNARVFCANMEDPPVVAIRGSGTDWVFAIENGQFIEGGDPNQPAVQKWICDHQAELMQCWKSAQQSNRRYYPES